MAGILAQKKVTVDGIEYTLQKIPYKSFLQINDRCSNKYGVLQKTQYSEEMLAHVVVQPKVTLSNFDDNFNAGMELVAEAENFLVSKPDKSPNKKESKE